MNLNNHITLKTFASVALVLGTFLFGGVEVTAQTDGGEFKGRVLDNEGNPIAGAVVNVAEQSRIALTDNDGYFTLKSVNKNDEICASCVGYHSVIDTADFRGELQIVMLPDSDAYAHTMPVPFGRKAKKYMTEATSVVSGTELEKHPITVLQNAFTSTVNGVQTYEWSAEPGWTETQMYIRGIRTMNVNARNPLIIVDNVERDLSFLDAFPIESITILKDAAATAIYGMRGANGVVMVTTKRGQAGKTNISFTQEVGFQKLSEKMEVQNSYNLARTRNQVAYLSGKDPIYSEEEIEKYRKVSNGEKLEGVDQYKYFNTNWFDVLYRESAPMIKTNFQINGGNNRTRYYISFSYLHQGGMWNEEGTKWNENYSTQHRLNRYNLRSNIDIDVNRFLNVQLDLGGRIDDITQPTQSVFDLTTFGAVEADPMQPVYCPNGELYASSTANNPIRYLAASGQEKNRRRNLYSTVTASGDLGELIKPLKGLKINAMVSFDSFETFESTQRNSIETFNYDYKNADVQDVNDFTYTKYSEYSALNNPTTNQREYYYHLNMNYGLSYERVFGKHNVDARAFMRTYQSSNNAAESSQRNLSYNAQLTYSFDNRYVLNGNFSHMGSDNYHEDERWGNFYGVSGAWIASEESFLENVDFIEYLKLRASYGLSGQSNTGAGRYPFQSTFEQNGNYGFGHNATSVNGFIEAEAGNKNNKWETSKMLNIGLDFDFLKGAVYGQVDVFKEWRSGILVDRSTIPSLVGVAVAQDSYGEAETRGLELTIGHKGNIGPVKYHIEGMLTYNTNEITEMDETEPSVEWQRKTGNRILDYTSVANLYEIPFNNTIGGWNIYKFDGWASDPSKIAVSVEDAIANQEKYPYHTASNGAQALGTAVFKDLNGDRKIDSNDKTPDTYTIIPELIPAVNIGFEAFGFDVRAVLNAYLNRSVFLSPAISYSGWSNMGTHEVTKAWGYYNDDPSDPRNINAKYPRPLYGGFNAIDSERGTGTYENDIWVQNGNFLSLRNVEFGYSLPQSVLAKVGMTKCRIYFTGYNLKNWSNLPAGVDPEKPMSYCWWYPKTRSFTFGVNLGF